ncbi:MAG: hypothetical protein RIR26_2311 [Pseudomonadota bacterium]|jgi:hypothetical protein
MFSFTLAGLNSLLEATLIFIGAVSPRTDDNYQSDKPAFALIAETNGQVRYKRSHSATWFDARMGTSLFPGDRIFVEEDGNILIRYPSLKSTVYCSTPSMFSITEDIELIRHRDRWFVAYAVLDPKKEEEEDKNNTEETKREKNYFVETVEKPGDRDRLDKIKTTSGPKSESKKLEQLSFELSENRATGFSRQLKFDSGVFSYVRQVNLLVWKKPRGKYDLVTQKFPAKIDVEVENSNPNVLLYAYLWKDKNLNPKWSGVSKSVFTNVVIPEPGRYKMQVFSEDSSAASDYLEINATQKRDRTIIPTTWDDGQTRWLDDE